MKYKSIMVLAAMALLVQGICSADGGKSTVTVSGMGKVAAKPDVAYVTLYVKADGLLMADVAQKIQQKTDDIKKAITAKQSGVKEIIVKDVSVANKDLRWAPTLVGYAPQPEMVKQIRITLLPNPQIVYDVIDAAIQAGAFMNDNSVHFTGDSYSCVVYGLIKSDEAEAQARSKALEDARGKAETLAALADKRLGEITSIEFSDNSFNKQYEIAMQKASYPTRNLGVDPTEINIVSEIEFVIDLVKK